LIMSIPDNNAETVLFEEGWNVTVDKNERNVYTVVAGIQYKPGGSTRFIYACGLSVNEAMVTLANQLNAIADVVLFGIDGDTTDHYKRIMRFASVIRQTTLKN